MATTKIEGTLIGFWISTNLTTPAWKEVVCNEDLSLEGSRDIRSRTTKCGTFKGKGNPSYTIPGSGVANATPETNQVSVDEVFTIFQDGTDVLWKMEHATDSTIYHRSGQGFFSAYSEGAPADDLVDFDWTLDVDGEVSITATP